MPKNETPLLLKTLPELNAWRSSLNAPLAFVPTMGALHPGHAKLLSEARTRAPNTLLSIFVNPTQFGPQEDFSRYPRTLDSDLEVARNTGVSAVFVPTVEDVYPPGFSTFIEETEISKPLCGRFRPGHFRGVTTVVHRLFQLTRPDVALFGLKDLQQFLVLRRMVRDLGLPVQMAGIPTVREPDGLALSSRNRYLDPSLRERAPLLYRELRAAAEDLRTTRESIATLESAGFSVQYFERIELDGVRAIAAAAFLGTTRLIDNVVLGGL